MYRIGVEEVQEIEKLLKTKKIFRDQSDLKEVINFEKEWAEKIGTKYSICVTSGTAALICGLIGLGVGPGDEVIVPAYTFMATATAVLAVGAIPVMAEINETFTIDPLDIEKKISKYTKAIIPVHMRGMPCDMESIMNLANKYNLKVLEDACQADGGSFKGKKLGAWGDAGAFSYNFYKIISSGEGGSINMNDREVYEKALVYHDDGTAFRSYVGEIKSPIFIGVQYRASEIIGAVMRIQLQRLDGILEDLRTRKKKIMDRLSNETNVRFIKSNDIEGDCATFLGFQFDTEEQARAFRDKIGMGQLPSETGKHVYTNWKPILEKRGACHPAFNPFNLAENKDLNMNYSKDMCPKTLDILGKAIMIAINPDWTDAEVEDVIEKCKKAL